MSYAGNLVQVMPCCLTASSWYSQPMYAIHLGAISQEMLKNNIANAKNAEINN